MRILIVKTSALGDILHAFPVLSYLRHKFPDAAIDWVVEKGGASLLQNHPDVNHTWVIDTRLWRKQLFHKETYLEIRQFKKALQTRDYDLIFDLQGNTKSALFTWWARGEKKIGFGWKSVAEKPNLLATSTHIDVSLSLPIQKRYLHLVQQACGDTEEFTPVPVTLTLSSSEQERLDSLLSQAPFAPRFMVAFGSYWENKQLSLPTLLSFLQKLSLSYDPFFFLIYGTQEEKKKAEELTHSLGKKALAVGELSFPLWQALMLNMQAVIAMDSAALHLAGTTSVFSFSLFGPSLAAVYKPLGQNHHALQGPCPYHRTFAARCPILRTCPTGACMKNFKAEELAEAFTRLFRANQS